MLYLCLKWRSMHRDGECYVSERTGRNTSGVKLMSIDQDSDIKVASIAKVRESVTKDSNVYDEEYYEEENGDSEEESEADVDSDETV